MAGVREGTKSGKVTITQQNRTPSPRRVSDGFVCWLCDTRRTTELYYKLTPSPLCTQSRAVRHRLQNYKVGRLGREETHVVGGRKHQPRRVVF